MWGRNAQTGTVIWSAMYSTGKEGDGEYTFQGTAYHDLQDNPSQKEFPPASMGMLERGSSLILKWKFGTEVDWWFRGDNKACICEVIVERWYSVVLTHQKDGDRVERRICGSWRQIWVVVWSENALPLRDGDRLLPSSWSSSGLEMLANSEEYTW